MGKSLLAFETCPWCSGIGALDIEEQIPMVLSGDNCEMQCGSCNRSFRLPDCEDIRNVARHQRAVRYGTSI